MDNELLPEPKGWEHNHLALLLSLSTPCLHPHELTLAMGKQWRGRGATDVNSVAAVNSQLEQGPFQFHSVYSRAYLPVTAGYSVCAIP